MNAETKDTILDLNTMMEETLDSVQEIAGYENPPAGEYSLTVKDAAVDSYTSKDGVPGQRLKITYEIAATHSTANNEQPVPDGTLFTETFQATEQGLGFFKKRIKELLNVENVAGVALRDMLASVKGATVDARISIKKTPKKDIPGEFWENLNIKIVQK